MALTARQRNRLPDSAFAYVRGSTRKYPVPTKAQARRAGIPEGQRQRILRNAVARAAQGHTRGTKSRIQPVAKRRSGPTRGAWDGSHHARRR